MKTISTNNAPGAIGPYSQAVFANGMLFTSGQIALDPATNNVVEGGIKEQTLRVCKNLEAVLAASDMSFADVVKTTCFLSDMSYFAEFNEVYGQFFTTKPARSCVAVKDLPKGVLVEVELIASKN